MLDLSGVPAARWRVAARVAALHLGVSALIATAIAVIVVKVWFPYPFGELAGGLRLLWMIVAVDVVCGPALMLLLYSPSKTRRALAVDITLIVGLQAAALGYGAHTLAQARPLALVFEVDRFRVVSYADIPAASLPAAPAWVNPWSLGSPRVLAIRRAASLDEKISSISASLAGVEPSVQPDWWQNYALAHPDVQARARPVEDLRKAYPQKSSLINQAAVKSARRPERGEVQDSNLLLWLPLVGRRSLDWIVFLDPQTYRIRGYMQLDGFV